MPPVVRGHGVAESAWPESARRSVEAGGGDCEGSGHVRGGTREERPARADGWSRTWR